MDIEEAKSLANALKEADGLLSAFEAKGGKRLGKSSAPVIANYSMDGLNVKSRIPLAKIVDAAKRFRCGVARPDVDRPRFSILLTGAPGSGKTAFVHYLANEISAPLVSKKVSDILSKWMGETEKNIAEAFARASDRNAILFLDEIDSLLMSREYATHDWQVQNVNELLQQVEEFDGILIGATNYSTKLDNAVMRRFTFKLEFDYLTDEGKAKFFTRYFKDALSKPERKRLDAIDNLTPGDFRTVRESLFYVCEHETNKERLTALEEEAAAKHIRKSQPIGF